jgi:hypothetical protein
VKVYCAKIHGIPKCEFPKAREKYFREYFDIPEIEISEFGITGILKTKRAKPFSIGNSGDAKCEEPGKGIFGYRDLTF